MRTPLRVFLAAGMFLGGAAAVSAQTSPNDEVRENAKMHVGPLYFTPTFALRELGVDTNVFNEAGEPKSDFTFTVSPKLETWLPVARRASLKATTGLDLVYYHTYSAERSVNPDVALRGEAYLHRITLFAEPSYLRTRQRPSFEIDARSLRVEKALVAGVDIRVLPKLSFEVSGRGQKIEFDADEVFLGTSLRETLNRESKGGRLTTRWRFTPLTTIALRAEAQSDRFPFSPVRDTDSVLVAPGVELKPRALINGSAYVGIRRFQSVDGRIPDYQGLVAQATLAHTLRGATSVYFSADRDVNYSFEQSQPYYVLTGANIGVRRHLAGKFDAMAGVGRYRYAYRELLVQPASAGFVAQPERVDTTDNLSFSIGYKVGKDGRLGVGATYWRRESTTRAFRNYDGLRAGTSFTYGF